MTPQEVLRTSATVFHELHRLDGCYSEGSHSKGITSCCRHWQTPTPEGKHLGEISVFKKSVFVQVKFRKS